MKRILCLLLFIPGMLCASPEETPAPVADGTPTPPAEPEDRLGNLGASQVEQAVKLLREKHVQSASLDQETLARATLRGLLQELAPGAELVPLEKEPPVASRFRSEVLDERAGYILLGSLSSEHAVELEAALKDFSGRGLHGIVLDLRATPESQDFAVAAQAAGLFCPHGVSLFSLSRPNADEMQTFTNAGRPLWRGPLVVIVDEKTAGAPEALAGALRWHARALLVGSRTSGRAVQFESFPLDDRTSLRWAAAQVLVAGQPLHPRGLRPDIEVTQEPEVREAVLAGAGEKGAATYVFENDRVQMNEASLVAGVNPEIDRHNESSVLLDRPLQRAVDLVTAIRLFDAKD